MDHNDWGTDHKKVKSMYKAGGIEYHKPKGVIKGNKASKNRK